MEIGTSIKNTHFGRSFSGTRLEDDCPCRKEDCGLVSLEGVDENCDQHPPIKHKTMRQIHSAETCPAYIEVWEDEDGELIVVGTTEIDSAMPKIIEYYKNCFGEYSDSIPPGSYLRKILSKARLRWVDRTHDEYLSELMPSEIFSDTELIGWSPMLSVTNWWRAED